MKPHHHITTRHILLLAILLTAAIAASASTKNPKWEFRGAWISTVYQEQYKRQTTEQNKEYLRGMLDKLKDAGCNAVIFQVRPSADAFYDSRYELWSRYLTTGGAAPKPFWDPLEFMVEEAHARGMELHAWLNPYRVTTSKNERLPRGHLYHREPDRFVRFTGDGKIYFDPGLPENRKHITDVVLDIVERYDIDAIHFDDYFYPYPVSGHKFPDDKSFKKYGKGMRLADWRRSNVDKLISDVSHAIRHSSKPWVRFGISPFGIWRNKSSDKRGSASSGLQNYDDLYADVLLWAEKGWIDYLMPQLYWEIGHKKAPSDKLAGWWDEAVDPKCHVYIGQDVERTMNASDRPHSRATNQLDHKVEISRSGINLLGNCWWPAYSLTSDYKGVARALARGAQSTPALVPPYTNISDDAPDNVDKVRLEGKTLCWKAKKKRGKTGDQVKFVVYRFDSKYDMDYSDPENIYDIVTDNHVTVNRPGVYTVTALDRVNNESDPSKPIVVKKR